MPEIDIQKADVLAQHLGQDFLTWLWYYTEIHAGQVKNSKQEDLAVYLEQRVSVQGGEGESRETAVSSGQMSELKEARAGLAGGKKVNQARIRVEQDSEQWQFQLRAEDFAFSGVKTPKVEMKVEEGEDIDSRFLEKMYLLEKATALIDDLLTQFLSKRLQDDWPEELLRIRKWINS